MKPFDKLILTTILVLVSPYSFSEASDVEEINFNSKNYKESTATQIYLKDLRAMKFKKYSISNVDMNIKDNIPFESELWKETRTDIKSNIIKLEENISTVIERQNDGSWEIKFQNWN